MCGGGGSSSPALSVLFRHPTPAIPLTPTFVHYLPKPRASPLTGAGVTNTWFWELRAAEGMWITGQILSLISWRPRAGSIKNYWLFLILSQQWGWTGWGLRLLGDALSPTFLASFPRDPRSVGGWGISNLPLPMREVTCQPEKPASEFPGFSPLFLSN